MIKTRKPAQNDIPFVKFDNNAQKLHEAMLKAKHEFVGFDTPRTFPSITVTRDTNLDNLRGRVFDQVMVFDIDEGENLELDELIRLATVDRGGIVTRLFTRTEDEQ